MTYSIVSYSMKKIGSLKGTKIALDDISQIPVGSPVYLPVHLGFEKE